MDTHAPTQSDINGTPGSMTDGVSDVKDANKPSWVELKGNKIVFKQKPIEWGSGLVFMKALVAFNEFLERQHTALTSIPEQHLGVIAKLVHESDKTLNIACKHIKKALCPRSVENDVLGSKFDSIVSLETLEKTVNRLAQRRNYGLDDAPAALSIWRWEVTDLNLVQDAVSNKELAEQRMAERVQAKSEVMSLIDALPSEQKIAVLKKKDKADVKHKLSKEKGKDILKDASESPARSIESNPKPALSLSAKQAATHAKKVSTQKSAAVMASFFSKASVSKASASRSQSISISKKDHFDGYFRPFTLGKNKTLAPINRFQTITKKSAEVILVDDDVDMAIKKLKPCLSSAILPSDSHGFLHEFISSVPRVRRVRPSPYMLSSDVTQSSCASPRKSSTTGPASAAVPLKSHASISVRKVMLQLIEAEVNGDENGTRQLQDLLRNRRKLPAKLLQFDEDLRPPYYGTWTKSSAFVGPRTPFARDLAVFDYSYDSGEDWEEEDAEGAEEIGSDIDAEDESDDELDDDDGFLVPDDEIEMAESSSVRSRSRSLSPSILRPSGKRKAEGMPKRPQNSKKRRQIVGPLVPFSKGPCYETPIGRYEYEPFNGFAIRLLNDASFGLDPFTFVSTADEGFKASTVQTLESLVSSDISSLKTVASSAKIPSIFAMPQPPQQKPPSSVGTLGSPGVPASIHSVPAPSASMAKKGSPNFNLPSSLYPEFLQVIEGSDHPKAVLVDELYKAFKDRPELVGTGIGALRKGAVESKIAEIAFKEKKVWRVRPKEWLNAGLATPAR